MIITSSLTVDRSPQTEDLNEQLFAQSCKRIPIDNNADLSLFMYKIHMFIDQPKHILVNIYMDLFRFLPHNSYGLL